jgi:hypothetical protein
MSSTKPNHRSFSEEQPSSREDPYTKRKSVMFASDVIPTVSSQSMSKPGSETSSKSTTPKLQRSQTLSFLRSEKSEHTDSTPPSPEVVSRSRTHVPSLKISQSMRNLNNSRPSSPTPTTPKSYGSVDDDELPFQVRQDTPPTPRGSRRPNVQTQHGESLFMDYPPSPFAHEQHITEDSVLSHAKQLKSRMPIDSPLSTQSSANRSMFHTPHSSPRSKNKLASGIDSMKNALFFMVTNATVPSHSPSARMPSETIFHTSSTIAHPTTAPRYSPTPRAATSNGGTPTNSNWTIVKQIQKCVVCRKQMSQYESRIELPCHHVIHLQCIPCQRCAFRNQTIRERKQKEKDISIVEEDKIKELNELSSPLASAAANSPRSIKSEKNASKHTSPSSSSNGVQSRPAPPYSSEKTSPMSPRSHTEYRHRHHSSPVTLGEWLNNIGTSYERVHNASSPFEHSSTDEDVEDDDILITDHYSEAHIPMIHPSRSAHECTLVRKSDSQHRNYNLRWASDWAHGTSSNPISFPASIRTDKSQ